ncbi:MAG: protein translocase subunit SecD [Deltaproteobacteria bacterium]|nr:protein translocase subunit SecD [Deltaproteobacteria bacterium]
MDRSLKWRTFALLGVVALCLGILAPNVVDDPKQDLPSWFPFKNKINLGLDLKGGLHIVYSIDLNTAIVDRASEIERDLKARFNEEPKVNATVTAPLSPIGAVTVVPPDAAKKLEIEAFIKSDYGETVETRDCEPGDPPLAICFKVSTNYADSIKKSALENAVTTIRERIDNGGVAEPSVVQKDEQIIVELPGLDKDATAATRDLIARTAKLEFKVVDDGSTPGVNGRGSPYMAKLYVHVGSLTKDEALAEDRKENDPTEPLARQMGVYAMQDYWPVEDQPDRPHSDYFLKAYDRPNELVNLDEALKLGCVKKTDRARLATVDAQGNIRCDLKGWQVIQRYVAQTAAKDPSFKIDEAHQLGFEEEEPTTGDDKRPYWRSYYLWRAVRLTGTAITNASGSFEPNSGRPVVLLDFNRYGSRVFGDLTAEIVGQKLATILDDKVKSAPIINVAIRGGRASITMGGSDADRQLKDRDGLVNVLKTGSLPAPLREESSSELGPTLGRDAIDKTKLSFGLGVLLVVLIMVGIYRWSGWISVFALIFHNLLTLAVMAAFGATLTLPGIAAIVLSVGMTVDGNILIYERIRDELQLGKSVRGAVDLGFSRAFSAILDGQLTTAAAGWVLLQYGSGPIKGFATLLLVGVFTTITTNIWVTRFFFDWYIAKKKGSMATISI